MSESHTRLIQFQRLGILILAFLILYQHFMHKEALDQISHVLPSDVDAHVDTQDTSELQSKLRNALIANQNLEGQIAGLKDTISQQAAQIGDKETQITKLKQEVGAAASAVKEQKPADMSVLNTHLY